MEENQAYRASVAAMIVNTKGKFLLTQLALGPADKWDFLKGGMKPGEEPIDTLVREIREELGPSVRFKVLQRSNVYHINDWPEEMQKRKGFRGQARVSYWVLYEGGEIYVDTRELRTVSWFDRDTVIKHLVANRISILVANAFIDELRKIIDKDHDFYHNN